MKNILLVLLCLATLSASAQTSKLYLDAQAGLQYSFVEGAHFGKGVRPLKARLFILGVLAAPMLRFQTEKWSVAAGYSGGFLSYSYRLQVPKGMTHYPHGSGDRSGTAVAPYAHRFPLYVGRTLAKFNFVEIDTIKHLYLTSFRLDALIGGGLQRHAGQCLNCSGGSAGGGWDTIIFRPRPYYSRTWGGFVSAGVAAHFYRLGQERATLRLLFTQGLQDMIVVPLDYSYNSRRGSTVLHARGTGITATLGYPLRLHTFQKKRLPTAQGR